MSTPMMARYRPEVHTLSFRSCISKLIPRFGGGFLECPVLRPTQHRRWRRSGAPYTRERYFRYRTAASIKRRIRSLPWQRIVFIGQGGSGPGMGIGGGSVIGGGRDGSGGTGKEKGAKCVSTPSLSPCRGHLPSSRLHCSLSRLRQAPVRRWRSRDRSRAFTRAGKWRSLRRSSSGPDGRFNYALSYGALDEQATGRWTVSGDRVLLSSNPVVAPRLFLVSRGRGPEGMLQLSVDVPRGVSR
jgi:hypothetical protein